MVSFACLLGVSWVTGVLVGVTGVGGILVIPGLIFLGGLDIHAATATALFTFMFLGSLGAWLFWLKGSIVWRTALPVCISAIPFSFAGSLVNSLVGSADLNAFVALTIAFAGIYMFVPARAREGYLDGNVGKQRSLLMGIGALSGFGSGLSGAGGPVFSVPLMLISRFEPMSSIGAAQLLVLISSASATLANLRYGSIDFALGAWLGAFELVGLVMGVNVGHSARVRQHLRGGVATLCIAIGVLMLAIPHGTSSVPARL